MSKELQELYREVAARKPLSLERRGDLVARIQKLKKDRNALILAHNYQLPEVKLVADRLGDSYDLSLYAREATADWIVFCGVRFMAETAKLLNPSRKVVLPESRAGCDLASSIDLEKLRALKREHPNARTVLYINCFVDVKAEADAICTSANAAKVVGAMDSDEVIFGPDRNLGAFVAKQTKKKLILWPGYCPIHDDMTPQMVDEAIAKHPNAIVIVHPEVPEIVQKRADAILGTQQMLRYAGESKERAFIVGTEIGLVEQLRVLYPDKNFWPIYEHKSCDEACACPFMKITGLESVARALETGREEIVVPAEFQEKALRAVQRMIEIGR